jgi:hypothetical protein
MQLNRRAETTTLLVINISIPAFAIGYYILESNIEMRCVVRVHEGNML